MDFIVFSDDWARHPSSCQHLFRYLTKNHRALWVNTIGMRGPKLDSFTAGRSMEKFRQWARPLVRVSDNLHVYSPAMLPTGGKSAIASMNASLCAARIRSVCKRLGFDKPVLFSSIPTGADYIGLLGESALVYYITDNYQLWPGGSPEVIAAQDTRLKISADLLLPVGEALAHGLENCKGRVSMLPHAVDAEHFAASKAFDDEPDDIKKIPGPRLCFFGLIYEKIDLELLEKAAKASPDKSLVMIGPVKTDVSELEKLSNVHFLGSKSYDQLPRYLNACDATLLAYKLDDQTRQNAPLKIRECLALGKPVIARSITDLQQYGHLIHLADTDDEFVSLFAQGGHLACDAAAMRKATDGQSWQARSDELQRELSLTLSEKNIDVYTDSLQVDLCRDASEWNGFVYGRSNSSVWHDGRWTEIMAKAYKLKTFNLVCKRGDKIIAALPLALQKSMSFGRHLVSLPWLDHAGIIADEETAASELLNKALEISNEYGCDLQIRNIAGADRLSHPALSNCRSDKVAMVLDLPDDSEILWSGLKAKVRNQVRKADKSCLNAKWAGPAELQEFYDIYSRNMRDLGSPPHSLEFFQRVLESLRDRGRILLVDNSEFVVAGALVLTHEKQWQVPWASSLREFNSLCPNHLMYWTILEQACGKSQSFSFGRSSRDSGTYKFKAQWGCRELPLRWDYYLGEKGYDGQHSKFAELISSAWKKIPVSVARKVGPGIIRSVS